MRFGFPQIINLFGICLLICTLQLARLTLFALEYKTHLSPSEMHQDLHALLNEVKQHSAFSALNSHKIKHIENQFEPILYRASGPINTQDFYAEVIKLMVTLDDPGLSVISPIAPLPRLPFTLRPVSNTWLALDEEGHPIDSEHPFITHIDGIPLSLWEKMSQRYISAPLKHNMSERVYWLSQIPLLRRDIGMISQDEVRLSLSDNIDSSVQLSLALIAISTTHQATLFNTDIEEPALYSEQTAKYIPIAKLSAFDNDKALRARLETAAERDVTIIDLRQASQSSDNFFKFLTRYDSTPQYKKHNNENSHHHLIALGQYRRSVDFKSDFLRPLGFIPYDEFDFFEQVEFKQASQSIPSAKDSPFGHWYGRRAPTAVMSPQGNIKDKNLTDDPASNLLGIIIGPECRRECEWLAYYAKSLSRVTLIGEKTAGDLGRHYIFTLPNSGITIELTASLTYDMQGQLLSSVGIEPDIPLPINEELQLQGLLSLIQSEFSQPSLHADTQSTLQRKGVSVIASQSKTDMLNSKEKVAYQQLQPAAPR